MSDQPTRSDLDRPADPNDPTQPDQRASYEQWLADQNAMQAHQPADSAPANAAPLEEEATCPTCGAPDVNPSGEVLPHCWRCGHRVTDANKGDVWPPADLEDRKRTAALARLGL